MNSDDSIRKKPSGMKNVFYFIDVLWLRIVLFAVLSITISVAICLINLFLPTYTFVFVLKSIIFIFCVPFVYLFTWELINIRVMVKVSQTMQSTVNFYWVFHTIKLPRDSLNISSGKIDMHNKHVSCGMFRVILSYQTDNDLKKRYTTTYKVVHYTSRTCSELYRKQILKCLQNVNESV